MFKTYEQKLQEAYQLIAKEHFGEMIDWNIQTSMYGMLLPLIKEIDERYLNELSKCNDITNVSVQLEDAILATMLNKGITFQHQEILTLTDLLRTYRKENKKIDNTKKIFSPEKLIIKLTSDEFKDFPSSYCEALDFLNDKFSLAIVDIIDLKKINGINNKLVEITYIK